MKAAWLGKGQVPDRHYLIDSFPDPPIPPFPPVGVTVAVRVGNQEGFSSLVEMEVLASAARTPKLERCRED